MMLCSFGRDTHRCRRGTYVVVLAGAWALPVTRAVVYFARVEKGCQVAGGPLLINDGMGNALSWACGRGGGSGLTMSKGVEVGGGGGV